MINQRFNIQGASGKPLFIDLTAKESAFQSLVIFVHGFKGFKDWGTHRLVAKYFAQNNLAFLKFNFSHNGISQPDGDIFDDLESFSKNTFSKELFDLNQVITFAASGDQFLKPAEIFLVGHSLGGAISIIETSQNQLISKLVTWSSISSFRNLWTPEQEKTWHQQGFLNFINSRTNQQMPINADILMDLEENEHRLNILNASSQISKPWLIIHGNDDTSVSPHQAIRLNEESEKAELLLIPNADHVFGASHPWNKDTLPTPLLEVCNATIRFLRN